MTDVIREFLLETMENLTQLDTDLITLEKVPGDRNTLARVFRTLHTVKGTAGFLGLTKLQTVAHAAESLLGKLRAGDFPFNRPIATALLAVVDAIRQVLSAIETGGDEGRGEYGPLAAELDHLRETGGIGGQSAILPAGSLPPAPSKPPKSSLSTPNTAPLAPPPVEPHAEATDGAEARAGSVADTSIRVDVGLLDKLMTLVGELVLARNQIVQYAAAHEELPILGIVQRLNLLTSELQAGVMKTRMQPIATLWAKFPRLVRDLALACQKKVRFDTEGQGTELDKTILEAIRDPLTHMIRNAVDHGIESPEARVARGKPAEGRLSLHAFHESGKVVVEVSDDGGGIDPARVREKAVRSRLISATDGSRMTDAEAVNLIFFPGFSTADQVTDVSGRGVGMDVVRTNVERIGGTVDVESQPGLGTTLKMKIPLTLAIIPALSVSCGGERFCIPQVNLLELVRLDGDQVARRIENLHGAPVYRLRGQLLPIAYLDRQLQLPPARPPGADLFVVVLQADDRHFGLVVDAIHDTEEIVVKPLQKQLKGVTVYAGATILGDGRVALILDVLGLAQRAGVVSGRRGRTLAESVAVVETVPLLLFTASDGTRMAMPLAAVARLEEFPLAALEKVGRRRMVQYRGEILPLVDVGRELRRMAGALSPARKRRRPRPAAAATGTAQVIVCGEAGSRAGLLVREILDIVEQELVARGRPTRLGVLHTAVVQERVTEFLDVPALLQAATASGAG